MKHTWQAIALIAALALCSLPAGAASTDYTDVVTITDATLQIWKNAHSASVQWFHIGDTHPRLEITQDGDLQWGSGAAAADTALRWQAQAALAMDTGNVFLIKGGSGDWPGTPIDGMIYYNTLTGKFRGYEGGAWTDIIGGGGGGGAPTSATYITQTHDATLSAEQAMGDLATGLVKNTTTTGVQSIAVAGTDYVAPTTTAKRSIMLRPFEMWASSTNGATGITKTQMPTNKQNVQEWDFSGVAKQYIEYATPMPDNWDGSTIKAIFYWSIGPTADTKSVRWGIQGRAYADQDAIDQAWGTAQEVTDTCTSTANQFLISAETSACTLAGSPAAGQMVLFRVYRDPTNGADDELGSVQLDGIKVEYSAGAYSE